MAAKLRATDAETLDHLLARVGWDAQDGQINLGWLQLRQQSRGRIAAATHYHAGLTQVLCRAFAQVNPRGACATIAMARGAHPKAPYRDAQLVAALHLRPATPGKPASTRWSLGGGSARAGQPMGSQAICIHFFSAVIAGNRAQRDVAALTRAGFPLWRGEPASAALPPAASRAAAEELGKGNRETNR